LYGSIKADDLKTLKKEAQDLAGHEVSFKEVNQDEAAIALPDQSAINPSDLCPISLAVHFRSKECFKHLLAIYGLRKAMSVSFSDR
jgi:hypothetical protein